jgi:GNAT superfamily N-acetyltransferase
MSSPQPNGVEGVTQRFATAADVPVILELIRELAEYERLSHDVVADEGLLRENLFGDRRVAEVIIAKEHGEALAFALFFHNLSTFVGRPEIYLEDIYVRPRARGRGIGNALLVLLAKIAVERGCGRMEWSVLDWNEPAIGFHLKLGAAAMDEWTGFRLAGPAPEGLAGTGGAR